LEEAAQQITDKISISGVNKMKRLGANISRKKSRFALQQQYHSLDFWFF
jgi:hypothetical protein